MSKTRASTKFQVTLALATLVNVAALVRKAKETK